MASTTMTNSDKCSQRAMLSSSGHVILLDDTHRYIQTLPATWDVVTINVGLAQALPNNYFSALLISSYQFSATADSSPESELTAEELSVLEKMRSCCMLHGYWFTDTIIREHGSVSLCRDGQKTKWRLQCKY